MLITENSWVEFLSKIPFINWLLESPCGMPLLILAFIFISAVVTYIITNSILNMLIIAQCVNMLNIVLWFFGMPIMSIWISFTTAVSLMALTIYHMWFSRYKIDKTNNTEDK